MAKKKARAIAKFRHAVDVEVHQPRIKLLSSFRFLDFDALEKAARAEVAIGEVDGGCCGHAVYAQVRRGEVVGIRTEACADGKGAPLPREHRDLVEQAFKRAASQRRARGRFPLPVRPFFGSAAVAQQTSGLFSR